MPLVQLQNMFDDGMRGRAFQQTTVAAATQGLLQLLEIGVHLETDQLSHPKSLPQCLDSAAPLGFGQALMSSSSSETPAVRAGAPARSELAPCRNTSAVP
jgi:hypothetical protein